MSRSNSLYPDILFHFTTESALFGILSDTFSVSYAREKIAFENKSRYFAVPMVSFCDLRLSELKEHMGKYGEFGIGLTKKWAMENGLNPVFYLNKSSSFTGEFINSVEGVHKLIESDKVTNLDGCYMGVLNAYRYMKNYEGTLMRKDGPTTRDYRFADEREWRFVPPLTEIIHPFLEVEKIKTTEGKNRYNQTVAHIRLRFTPDDIKYLIVKSDSDIDALITYLDGAKSRFDEPTRRRLVSRILTADQINSDV